jgi:hypothetical protein
VDRQLAVVIRDLESAEQRLRTLRSTLPCDAWFRRPGETQWSAAECVAHLNLTSAAMLPPLRAGLAEAGDGLRRTASRYRRDPIGWLIWKAMTPAGGLRTRTLAAFVPSGESPLPALMAEFERLQAEAIACVHAADGLPIDDVKVVSPFDGRVRYNLFAALTIIPRHQHRHLLQAERAAAVVAPGASPIAVQADFRLYLARTLQRSRRWRREG